MQFLQKMSTDPSTLPSYATRWYGPKEAERWQEYTEELYKKERKGGREEGRKEKRKEENNPNVYQLMNG